jgi:hypothetical protein
MASGHVRHNSVRHSFCCAYARKVIEGDDGGRAEAGEETTEPDIEIF